MSDQAEIANLKNIVKDLHKKLKEQQTKAELNLSLIHI